MPIAESTASSGVKQLSTSTCKEGVEVQVEGKTSDPICVRKKTASLTRRDHPQPQVGMVYSNEEERGTLLSHLPRKREFLFGPSDTPVQSAEKRSRKAGEKAEKE